MTNDDEIDHFVPVPSPKNDDGQWAALVYKHEGKEANDEHGGPTVKLRPVDYTGLL